MIFKRQSELERLWLRRDRAVLKEEAAIKDRLFAEFALETYEADSQGRPRGGHWYKIWSAYTHGRDYGRLRLWYPRDKMYEDIFGHKETDL